MGLIDIKIPDKKNSHYTLFAEGEFVTETFENEETHIFLKDDRCIMLYYKYHLSRFLFLCINPDVFKYKHNICHFPETSKDLTVFKVLRGRGYDQFKKTIEYLRFASQNDVYTLPVLFFWQLANICEKSANNKKNIQSLWEKYSTKKLLKINWKEIRKTGKRGRHKG